MSDPKAHAKAAKKAAKADAKTAKKRNKAAGVPATPSPSHPGAPNQPSPAERSAQAAEQQVRLQKRRVWIALIGSLIGLLTLIATLS